MWHGALLAATGRAIREHMAAQGLGDQERLPSYRHDAQRGSENASIDPESSDRSYAIQFGGFMMSSVINTPWRMNAGLAFRHRRSRHSHDDRANVGD
jgi:hypothetical protein